MRLNANAETTLNNKFTLHIQGLTSMNWNNYYGRPFLCCLVVVV